VDGHVFVEAAPAGDYTGKFVDVVYRRVSGYDMAAEFRGVQK
jgi:hypothetical protein